MEGFPYSVRELAIANVSRMKWPGICAGKLAGFRDKNERGLELNTASIRIKNVVNYSNVNIWDAAAF